MGCGEANDWFRMTQRHQDLSVNIKLPHGPIADGDENVPVPRREEHDRYPGPGGEPLAAGEPIGLEPQLASMIPLGVEEVHSSAANGSKPLAIAAECDPAYA